MLKKLSVFGLTLILLIIVKIKAPFQTLIFERLYGFNGWLGEAIVTGLFAVLIFHVLYNKKNVIKYRKYFWAFYSFVFFSQLVLGVFVNKIFLMTGKLHIPVPAMIVAGPIYRGYGFFMPILYGAILLIIGSAWCSYCCYFGALDSLAASTTKTTEISKLAKNVRFITFIVVLVASIALGTYIEKPVVPVFAGILFGIIGLITILFVSKRKGIMFHCIAYCPIGMISNYAGMISPFRIKINNDCSKCMKCTKACKYGALQREDVLNKAPGRTCSLCGDCLSVCNDNAIEYKYLNLKGELPRNLFLILVSTALALLIAIARI